MGSFSDTLNAFQMISHPYNILDREGPYENDIEARVKGTLILRYLVVQTLAFKFYFDLPGETTAYTNTGDKNAARSHIPAPSMFRYRLNLGLW